ncbi:MAG TPA: response regulator, partial [Polyangiales bacterium]|nr:response regulator [Polyangiales bacterium]
MSTEPCVWVVDDDPSIRDALTGLLRSADIPVTAFSSGNEFLSAFRTGSPACAVLDMTLPDLTGLEIQARLRREAIQVPVVFLTGFGDIDTSVQAIKAGAVDFLTKPLDNERLLATVGAIVEAARNGGTRGAVGRSAAWREALGQVEVVAATDA